MKVLFLSDFVPLKEILYSKAIHKLFNDADKIIFNLEGSFCSNKSKTNQLMPFSYNDLTQFFNKFKKEKFIVALANNHILDNGATALDELINLFKIDNVNYFGVKDKPHFSINNQISILNFVTAETGARYSSSKKLNYLFYDTSTINSQISELEKTNEKLILYPHWGRDMDRSIFKTYKLKYNKERWQVFGHHSHVISNNISSNFVYSMGNTYIPHPYYYKQYPATKFGLAIMVNTLTNKNDFFLTKIKINEKNITLDVNKYDTLPNEIKSHGNSYSTLKKYYLSIFSFKGEKLDFFKLHTIQFLSIFFKIIIKIKQTINAKNS